ncbi:gamma-glutamyltransferase [Maritimibacter sp. 55A14]|uniref:gamma-glutamyltransferase n=1 Tax=Maritimibacter sp. 55A14 TaxID=2174844 RepID=UPI000D604B84|nr:gamma-glutamyltransferase [Maritimibacter sp. 55A14]PWE33746.1 gamma-glutamyltransferase [Maritimibacter sp. 55A14]
MIRTTLGLCALLTALALPLFAQQAADAVAPEGPSELAQSAQHPQTQAALEAKQAGRPVRAHDWMVAAAHPLAAEAGAEVLARGGSAADAMVAVQAVLGLVEPQSSGLGGGAFLVWYDAATGALTTLDGRETAPLDATPRLFQDENGAPMEFFDAVIGGRSVGTPGTPALLEEAHRRWGRANWAGLFDAAIGLAEDGFEVSPRLAAMVAGDMLNLMKSETARPYFLPGGVRPTPGHRLRNPAYAATLRAIARDGARAFYTGAIARDIVATVQGASDNPGTLSMTDLALYRVRERPPVCAPYRGRQVCGMGPPSSGALTLGQILGLVEPFDLAALGPRSAEAWRLIGDASRLAFADRGRYMADSDFVAVPVKGLIAPDYLRDRAALLRGTRALDEAAPGEPEFDHALRRADDIAIELPSTSHISIVDSYGNALAMTTTIENGFGSRLMTNGFLLNNELTDFSFATHSGGRPIANALAPGKRPRSSMSPTIVMEDGAPVLVLGSPGGSRIIGYVAQALIAHLDWGMDVQQAVAMPHLLNRFGAFEIEAGSSAMALQTPLEALGFETGLTPLVSGLHAIAIGDDLQGGADPRREGVALGR